jgi:hypothetical protein
MSQEFSARPDAPLDLTTVTAADFRGAIGRPFHVAHAGGELDLRLVDVAEWADSQRDAGAFTLLFVGPPGPHLPQAIYALTDASLGIVELFLVPIGPAEGGNGYEAVFA